MTIQLHSLFRPVQANGRVATHTYVEWLPSAVMQPYVSCYWASEPYESGAAVLMPGGEGTDRVLPDGCTDLLFEQDREGNHFRVSYCGMFDQAFTIAYDKHRPVHKYGVRFFPGGAHALLKLPTAEFTNRLVPLACLWPRDMEELGGRIVQEPSMEAKIRRIEEYLISLLKVKGAGTDALMQNLLHRIFVSGGNIRIRELAEAEAISARQMNRKFDQWIGMGPKRFSEIVRFQAIVRAIRDGQQLNWSELALQYGFFDQAHLIREFRRFYGDTPGAAMEEYRNLSVLSNA
ncbi:helix-turn-helix domain-containing protein [Paenibacillus rigui]|uniref:HTH araC/xylS-type domain-containing protein n=1 Tax=Paenibacillus rigui TaxID=554312 RepID=A0A229UQ70_9BACL|nr:helix-turn-helix domain-containing protein [Paenibacillus rigui]OXM85697.1 hypothetical protein CF651_14075 [Paenibacillus rigui]